MEYRPYFLAREWTKLGHKVRVIAASESHLRQHNPTLTDKVFSEVIDGIDYLWLKTPAYKHNGIARVVNMLFFSMRLLTEKKQILNNFKPDIVIASSPQPFIIRGAKRLAQQTKAKLIYEVRDLWPLSLIELLGISRFHPLILLMQLEENYAYKHADK
ncbi:MAG: glycosyltransferase, partial [Gammaproteobacteria bacterium]|nr:glycosyltransferase [Gammaproteobacteria bacterium]